MKNVITTVATLTILGSSISQASLVLIEDDFNSATEVTASGRLAASHITNGVWVQRLNNTDPAIWSTAGTTLTNDGTDDKGVHAVHLVSSVDTTLTQIEVSFDYTVAEGSTLYFYSSVYTGVTGNAGNVARITATGGATFATDITNTVSSQVDAFTAGFNLGTGAAVTNATTGALTSFTGGATTSGTFTQTYDISSFTGISSIADVEGIGAIFTIDGAMEQ